MPNGPKRHQPKAWSQSPYRAQVEPGRPYTYTPETTPALRTTIPHYTTSFARSPALQYELLWIVGWTSTPKLGLPYILSDVQNLLGLTGVDGFLSEAGSGVKGTSCGDPWKGPYNLGTGGALGRLRECLKRPYLWVPLCMGPSSGFPTRISARSCLLHCAVESQEAILKNSGSEMN